MWGPALSGVRIEFFEPIGSLKSGDLRYSCVGKCVVWSQIGSP